MNKFYGYDALGRVTQMEQYFSLHGFTDDLHNSKLGPYIWIHSIDNGGNGIRKLVEVTLFRPNL